MTASTWPADSIGSRTAALIAALLDVVEMMPFWRANAGHSPAERSLSAMPSVLPSISASTWMPRLLRATIA